MRVTEPDRGCKILSSKNHSGNEGEELQTDEGILKMRVQEMNRIKIPFLCHSLLLILINYLNYIWQ